MRRRSLLLGTAAALSGCTSKPRPPAPSTGVSPASSSSPSPTPAPSFAPMTPILASTKKSVLTPRPVERFAPVPGRAPADAAAVATRDFAFSRGERRLPVRVWYPTGADGRPAAGRFPLMVFSHGLTSYPDAYAPILSAWARAGIIVAAPRYPHTAYGAARLDAADIAEQPHDASAVITALLALDDPVAAGIDPARIGAGGHSAGAITTAGLFSRYRDSRLTAGVLVAGTDFGSTPFAGPPAGLLFVHGGRDTTVTLGAARTVFAAVPWSRAMLTLPAGRHVLTGADLAVAVRTSTEFLRWALHGDAGARSRLAPSGPADWSDQL